jgi:hypothetical protein
MFGMRLLLLPVYHARWASEKLRSQDNPLKPRPGTPYRDPRFHSVFFSDSILMGTNSFSFVEGDPHLLPEADAGVLWWT